MPLYAKNYVRYQVGYKKRENQVPDLISDLLLQL